MKAVPPSTPFPGLKGSDNNTSPAEFLQFLRSITAQYLGDNAARIAASNKDAWIAVVDGLTDHLLGSFPLPDIVSWNTMKEKIVMTEATLDVIRRVFLRVEGIYSSSEGLVKKLFVRLLNLCGVLDEKAFGVLVSILRGLGDHNPLISEGPESSWKVLRGILKECLDVCNGNQDLLGPMARTHWSQNLTKIH
ncbi:hypothetical protein GALMADRAFT_697464 [Galerina marginata CBS 339.88]|uniref:Uncharacterized protein n=1 Tax=Galerina marginata (strain CBS 339.88) TaxID=685588 RepID=A0A067TVY6_GALM3|nr:hypothetical protein GALMADRAFT_697464 [Galerina marginata CBS 339.88]